MRKQKYYANLTGGCGTARQRSQYVFLTPNLSDWYFSVYHDDMPQYLQDTQQSDHYQQNHPTTRMFRTLWRGITLTLFCHHNVRNSRLRLEINKVRTSVITLSNTTQGQLNSPTNPYLRFQNIPTTIKIRILWDRQNRTMFDTPSEGIVKSLLVLFFLAITVLVTLIVKEIRSSITEYTKHCTLNCKIDVVWSEIYFIFREKYSLDSSVIPMVE